MSGKHRVTNVGWHPLANYGLTPFTPRVLVTIPNPCRHTRGSAGIRNRRRAISVIGAAFYDRGAAIGDGACAVLLVAMEATLEGLTGTTA
jgi:hypothetical protein